MEEKILKATHQGKLVIGDKELNCAVLEDGTRILSSTAVFKAFDRPRRGTARGGPRAANMPSFIDAKNLQPYVQNSFGGGINFSIKYLSKTGAEMQGYKAELLPIICDVYLAARQDNVLTAKQLPLAMASEILVRSLSKIGIIALIDEATGYQEERERDELQKILAAYIRKELLPWTRRFPEEFYQEMFRLKGWEYKGNPKPAIVGKLTNTLVYERLPEGILEELQSKNPIDRKIHRRRFKHHQYLTESTGIPHLDKHLVSVITLMRACDTWDQFEKMFNRVFNIPYQMDLFDDMDQKENKAN